MQYESRSGEYEEKHLLKSYFSANSHFGLYILCNAIDTQLRLREYETTITIQHDA